MRGNSLNCVNIIALMIVLFFINKFWPRREQYDSTMLVVSVCQMFSLIIFRLNNLFSGLNEENAQRYIVYMALLKLAYRADLLSVVSPDIDEVSMCLCLSVLLPFISHLLRVSCICYQK